MDKHTEQANALAAQTLLHIAEDPGIDDLLRINLQSNAVKLAGRKIESLPEPPLPDFVIESTLTDWAFEEGSNPRSYVSCQGNTEWTCTVNDADSKSDIALLAEIKVSAITRFSIVLTRALDEVMHNQAKNN